MIKIKFEKYPEEESPLVGDKRKSENLEKAHKVLKWINIFTLFICLFFINIWRLVGFFSNPVDGVFLALYSGFLYYLYNFWFLYIPLLIVKIMLLSKQKAIDE